MTNKNLQDAVAGESIAHTRYLIFAEVAEREGYKNIARLFRAIAYAELVHAKNHYRALKAIGDTLENLKIAIQGEDYEVEEMYPVFLEVAKFQGERLAQLGFGYALEAEKIHAELYRKARDKVSSKEDINIENIYVCPICGYTSVDTLPDKCPICGVSKDKFIKF